MAAVLSHIHAKLHNAHDSLYFIRGQKGPICISVSSNDDLDDGMRVVIGGVFEDLGDFPLVVFVEFDGLVLWKLAFHYWA